MLMYKLPINKYNYFSVASTYFRSANNISIAVTLTLMPPHPPPPCKNLHKNPPHLATDNKSF